MTIKEKVAELLLRHRGEYISGEEMARHLGVSRAAVWKAVKQLESEGMCIQAATNRGYALSDAADILSPACISGYLRHPEVFAIQVEKTLDSTNRLARDLAQRGGREGTVVVAGEQTAGRGRLGRSFFSPGGTGVYFSLVLRPSPETEASLLTTAAAVAVAQAAEEVAKRPAEIKWVNDIYMDGKKICGILTEGTYSIEEGRMESAVLGIGVNVSPPAEGFPEELRKKAGTILEKPGNNARSRLIARILEIFWQYYENLDAGTFYSEYRRRSLLLGKRVEILGKGRREPAEVLDIGRDFSLILQKANGEIERLRAGEVEICYGKK